VPPGIALNPQTKECGYFGPWEDEYATFVFPSRWEKHYETTIKTETASCQWDRNPATVEACCHQLGYTYVPGNPGETRGHKELSLYSWLLLCTNPAILILLLMTIAALVAVFIISFAPGVRLKTQKSRRNSSSAESHVMPGLIPFDSIESLRSASRVAVLTGAGVSKDSGVHAAVRPWPPLNFAALAARMLGFDPVNVGVGQAAADVAHEPQRLPVVKVGLTRRRALIIHVDGLLYLA
jgi:hypothetical protein